MTTPEPVVTPTPIRSRPTTAVAAPMAATRRGIVWPPVRDGGGAVEPEFVAAAAEGDALDRAAPATAIDTGQNRGAPRHSRCRCTPRRPAGPAHP